MNINEAIDIIEGVIVEYLDSRTYQKYCLDNLLQQINGESLSYLDYKKELGIISKKAEKVIDKEKNRQQAKQSLQAIFGGGE